MEPPTDSAMRSLSRSVGAGIRRLLLDRCGATAVEYGFILALVVLAMLNALSGVGNVTASMWNDINSKVSNAH